MTHVNIVVNPVSGNFSSLDREENIKEVFENQGLKCIITHTTKDNKEVLVEKTPIVVILGGDGTINFVVNELMRKGWSDDVRIVINGSGTGNDLARTVGISKFQLKKLLNKYKKKIIKIEGKKIDLVKVEYFNKEKKLKKDYRETYLEKLSEKYFINSASFNCFDVDVVRNLKKMMHKAHSYLDFIPPMMVTALNIKRPKFKIRFSPSNKKKAKKVTDLSVGVIIYNNHSHAGGLIPNRTAKLDSGKLVMTYFKKMSFTEFLIHAITTHIGRRYIKAYDEKINECFIEPMFDSQLDGEYVPLNCSVGKISCIPGKIKVLCPELLSKRSYQKKKKKTKNNKNQSKN
jgi:diacylglycerol kinase family enzyme